MKKLLIILFSLVISFNSYGEWSIVSKDENSTELYIDFERNKSVDGYIYYWTLSNLLKPDKEGDLSYVSYLQGDCKIFRMKFLSEFLYKQPMGKGNAKTNNLEKNPDWVYPPPDSKGEYILELVCDSVNW